MSYFNNLDLDYDRDSGPRLVVALCVRQPAQEQKRATASDRSAWPARTPWSHYGVHAFA